MIGYQIRKICLLTSTNSVGILYLNYFKEFFYSDIGLPNVLIADINGKLRHDYLPTGFKLIKAVGINLVTPYLDKEVFNSLVKAPMETKYDYAY